MVALFCGCVSTVLGCTVSVIGYRCSLVINCPLRALPIHAHVFYFILWSAVAGVNRESLAAHELRNSMIGLFCLLKLISLIIHYKFLLNCLIYKLSRVS